MLETDRKERADEASINELPETAKMAQSEANFLPNITNSELNSEGNYLQLILQNLLYSVQSRIKYAL